MKKFNDIIYKILCFALILSGILNVINSISYFMNPEQFEKTIKASGATLGSNTTFYYGGYILLGILLTFIGIIGIRYMQNKLNHPYLLIFTLISMIIIILLNTIIQHQWNTISEVIQGNALFIIFELYNFYYYKINNKLETK